MRRVVPLAVFMIGAATGCAYYNGMWSAKQLAKEARRQEANGQDAEARLTWGRAAVKAESVLVHHPHSRWADDALVLQAEGLARSGACGAALEPLRRALRTVSDVALRERAALAGAECLLRHDGASGVGHLLSPVLTSRDRGRRSLAAYLAGEAALAQGNAFAAARLFSQSALPQAGPARLRALILSGRADEAIALVDSVAPRSRAESLWTNVLDLLNRAVGPDRTSTTLDSLLHHGRFPAGPRARLLLADGDRLRAARLFDRAGTRYADVIALVPDSLEAGRARIRQALAEAAQIDDRSGLDSIADRLAALSHELSGAAQQEAQAWSREMEAIRAADTAEITAFRAAELARDSFASPGLAAELFLRFAAGYPTSLFAPKALIAAGQLHRVPADSVERALQARYPTSPYTLAYHGASSPAYEAVEESLAIAFGVARRNAFPTRGAGRFSPPRTGPRGPELEPRPPQQTQRGRRRPGHPGEVPQERPLPRGTEPKGPA